MYDDGECMPLTRVIVCGNLADGSSMPDVKF